MKNLLLLLSLLTLVGCNNTELSEAKFKTITIKSVGETEVLPDMATFQIFLSCKDLSIKQSKECLIEKSNELNKQILSYGIKKEDILTTSINLEKQYRWSRNSRIFDGYQSRTTMNIKLRDIDKLDELYTELLENKNLELRGLQYEHSQLDSLKNESYVKALRKASILADQLLEELPETKKEILKVGNQQLTASMPSAARRSNNLQLNAEMIEVVEDQSVSNSVAINTGMVKVQATIFVEYQID